MSSVSIVLFLTMLALAKPFNFITTLNQPSAHSRLFTSFAMKVDQSDHSTSEIPHSFSSIDRDNFRKFSWSKAFTVGAAVAIKSFNLPANAANAADTVEKIYKDTTNGFSLLIASGWAIMPRKTPTATMLQYAPEEVLFTGSRFNEGGGASSLSVTRTNAVRLLKDFKVEWWFAPLESMGDLGSADLIAGLLILQRQGEVIIAQ